MMWSVLLESISHLSLWEWLAFLCGLVYVILASRNRIECWLFGISSSTIWVFVSFFTYGLYMDAGLNGFYAIMGIWGWINWKKSQSETSEPIRRRTSTYFLQWNTILLVGSVVVGVCLATYTQASLPFLDALTTIFSVFATILLIQRVLANWIYWVITDIIYIGIYMYKGAYLFMILFIIYTLLSIYGWIQWRKEWLIYKQSK